ncbi:MAG: phytanoyl-CoA dioxygenase family protein [Planctomycetaceae bacterium]|nr:phytanoyl-CoA dioxygenase family protein [Planctomycetaceae bacterium]MBT5599149.1 phytanoyl-CoA dioxygenase family protein [Planctomycetaceae bacterium]
MISDEQKQQFIDEGYFILDSVLSNETLELLRGACDILIDRMHSEMDRLGTDQIHISHRNQRYHIAKQYAHVEGLKEYVFGELMADICKATIGKNAYLFYDQYVAKAAEVGRPFAWHQDGGYLGFPHTPYVTVWAAVDDMTAENGTVTLLPYSDVGIRSLVDHIRNEESGDKVGYFGSAEGLQAIVPAGTLVVFSSLVFHCSSANRTDAMRRAYVTQYSPQVIRDPAAKVPKHLAVPFLENGSNIYDG